MMCSSAGRFKPHALQDATTLSLAENTGKWMVAPQSRAAGARQQNGDPIHGSRQSPFPSTHQFGMAVWAHSIEVLSSLRQDDVLVPFQPRGHATAIGIGDFLRSIVHSKSSENL